MTANGTANGSGHTSGHTANGTGSGNGANGTGPPPTATAARTGDDGGHAARPSPRPARIAR